METATLWPRHVDMSSLHVDMTAWDVDIVKPDFSKEDVSAAA